MEIHEALADMYFSKLYFGNGLVTLRDNPISMYDEKKEPRTQKVHKQSNQKIKKQSSPKTIGSM